MTEDQSHRIAELEVELSTARDQVAHYHKMAAAKIYEEAAGRIAQESATIARLTKERDLWESRAKWLLAALKEDAAK